MADETTGAVEAADAASDSPAPPAAPAAYPPPPVTVEIDRGEVPRVRIRVSMWGVRADDERWLDYAFGLVDGLLERHPGYRKAIADTAEARLASLRAPRPAAAAGPPAAAAGPRSAAAPQRRAAAPPPRSPSSRAPAPSQRRGGGRRDYDVVPDWECPECGGPCGLKPRTGRMRFDSIVCLGECVDDNGYALEVGRA